MELNGLQIDCFTDGTFYLDGGAMFGQVPKVLWNKKFPIVLI